MREAFELTRCLRETDYWALRRFRFVFSEFFCLLYSCLAFEFICVYLCSSVVKTFLYFQNHCIACNQMRGMRSARSERGVPPVVGQAMLVRIR